MAINQPRSLFRAACHSAYPFMATDHTNSRTTKGKKDEKSPGIDAEGKEKNECISVYIYFSILYTLGMRYLGVDYGTKKIGLAFSDEAGTMGFPHAVIQNTPKVVEELCALIAKENIGAMVIGESRTLAGGENPVAKEAAAFGTMLAEQSGVPVFFESEVFTSAEARRAPEKQKKSRSPKHRAIVDASAAALILTSYLSRTQHGSR